MSKRHGERRSHGWLSLTADWRCQRCSELDDKDDDAAAFKGCSRQPGGVWVVLGGLWAEVGLSHGWLFMRNFYAHTQRLFGSSSWHPGILVGEW